MMGGSMWLWNNCYLSRSTMMSRALMQTGKHVMKRAKPEFHLFLMKPLLGHFTAKFEDELQVFYREMSGSWFWLELGRNPTLMMRIIIHLFHALSIVGVVILFSLLHGPSRGDLINSRSLLLQNGVTPYLFFNLEVGCMFFLYNSSTPWCILRLETGQVIHFYLGICRE